MDHAQYWAQWLKLMRDDSNAIQRRCKGGRCLLRFLGRLDEHRHQVPIRGCIWCFLSSHDPSWVLQQICGEAIGSSPRTAVGHLVIRFLQRLNVGPDRFDFGRLIVLAESKGFCFFGFLPASPASNLRPASRKAFQGWGLTGLDRYGSTRLASAASPCAAPPLRSAKRCV